MLDPLVVTQKVRLKKDHTRDSKKTSHSGFFLLSPRLLNIR